MTENQWSWRRIATVVLFIILVVTAVSLVTAGCQIALIEG